MRIRLLIVLAALIFTAGICLPIQPLLAQEPPPTPTLTPHDTLMQAKLLAEDAAKQSNNANDIVQNADNAIKTTILLLNIVTGALLIGGILVTLIGVLAVQAVLRTLRANQRDLEKTRLELTEMRTELRHNADQMRSQAENAIKALALMQLGEQQLGRRNIDSALSLYKKAFELDPDNRAVNYFLGELYLQNGQLEKGAEHLQEALSPADDHAPTQAALGRVRWLQAEQTINVDVRDLLTAQAEERFLKALQIDPTALDIYGDSVHAVLGMLYKRQGRIDKAIYHYHEARKVAPTPSATLDELAQLTDVSPPSRRTMTLEVRKTSPAK